MNYIMIFLALFIPQAYADECSNVPGEINQIVCRDDMLKPLDLHLSELVKQMPGEIKDIISEQEVWYLSRESCKAQENIPACLKNEYLKRISEVAEIISKETEFKNSQESQSLDASGAVNINPMPKLSDNISVSDVAEGKESKSSFMGFKDFPSAHDVWTSFSYFFIIIVKVFWGLFSIAFVYYGDKLFSTKFTRTIHLNDIIDR